MKTIIRNTASSILLVTLVIIVIAANSTYTIHTMDELASLERRLFTTNQVINSINTLHLAVLRTESGQRGNLQKINPKHQTASSAQAFIGRYHLDLAVKITRNRVADTNTADQQSCQANKGQKQRHAIDKALQAGGSLLGISYAPAGFWKF